MCSRRISWNLSDYAHDFCVSFERESISQSEALTVYFITNRDSDVNHKRLLRQMQKHTIKSEHITRKYHQSTKVSSQGLPGAKHMDSSANEDQSRWAGKLAREKLCWKQTFWKCSALFESGDIPKNKQKRSYKVFVHGEREPASTMLTTLRQIDGSGIWPTMPSGCWRVLTRHASFQFSFCA